MQLSTGSLYWGESPKCRHTREKWRLKYEDMLQVEWMKASEGTCDDGRRLNSSSSPFSSRIKQVLLCQRLKFKRLTKQNKNWRYIAMVTLIHTQVRGHRSAVQRDGNGTVVQVVWLARGGRGAAVTDRCCWVLWFHRDLKAVRGQEVLDRPSLLMCLNSRDGFYWCGWSLAL